MPPPHAVCEPALREGLAQAHALGRHSAFSPPVALGGSLRPEIATWHPSYAPDRGDSHDRAISGEFYHEAVLPARLERGAEFDRVGPVREVPGLDPVEDAAIA